MDRRMVLAGGAAIALVAGIAGYQRFGGRATADPNADFIRPDALNEAGPLEEMVYGADDAPITLIEYASLTCGHCANFHMNTWPTLKTEYVDSGKVRLLYRDFPLDNVAAAGSMVARCAGKDKYFAMIDVLFQLRPQWIRAENPREALFRIAQQAGFSQDSFDACLQNQELLDGIQWVRDRAEREFGVSSTPTFFLNGVRIRGNQPLEEFRRMFDEIV